MTTKQRALVVCPGRGSYRPDTMNYLSTRTHPIARERIDACDAYRTEMGEKTITELDTAPQFKGQLHVAGENASLLTFACSVSDAADINTDKFDIVGVMGNSMGFYTALSLAGCLDFKDAIHLVETMAQYQKKNIIGGQVMYPITNEGLDDMPAAPWPHQRYTGGCTRCRSSSLLVYKSRVACRTGRG